VAPAREQEIADGRDGQEEEQEREGIEEHGNRSGWSCMARFCRSMHLAKESLVTKYGRGRGGQDVSSLAIQTI
jgi:hypothetical protein